MATRMPGLGRGKTRERGSLRGCKRVKDVSLRGEHLPRESECAPRGVRLLEHREPERLLVEHPMHNQPCPNGRVLLEKSVGCACLHHYVGASGHGAQHV